MTMVTALFGALEAGLRLWDDKEKHKYLDKLIELKKAWYEEYAKPLNIRGDDTLARIELELCQFSTTLATAIGSAALKDKS